MESFLSVTGVIVIPLVSAVAAKWLSSLANIGRTTRLILASIICPAVFLLLTLSQYVFHSGFDEAGLGIIINPMLALPLLMLGALGAWMQDRFWSSRS